MSALKNITFEDLMHEMIKRRICFRTVEYKGYLGFKVRGDKKIRLSLD